MKPFLLGMLSALILTACAGLGFHFTTYGMDLASYDGKLLAVKPENDLPASVCKPDGTTAGKCVVMLAAEFFRLKQDYLETQQRLIDCQAPK